MKRALCSDCHQSFPEDQIGGLRGRALCETCRLQAERAAQRRDSGLAWRQPDPPPASLLGRLAAGARKRCRGRIWQLRVPLLIWFAWVFLNHLSSAEYQSLFKPITLGIHELGHYALRLLGEFMGIAGGTIFQCLAPLAAAAVFWRQRDLFAIAVAIAWLSTSFFDVAVYAGDARTLVLPLVTPGGGDPIHDWNYMLGRLGILGWDRGIAFAFRAAGTALMAAAIAGGAWVLWLMFDEGRRAPREGAEVPLIE